MLPSWCFCNEPSCLKFVANLGFFLSLEQVFGAEAGGLLWSQAECEERFDNVNMDVDRLHMADLEAE